MYKIMCLSRVCVGHVCVCVCVCVCERERKREKERFANYRWMLEDGVFAYNL